MIVLGLNLKTNMTPNLLKRVKIELGIRKSGVPPGIVGIKGYNEMQAKNKPKKVGRPEVKRVCCPLLRKLKPDIENYTQKLIEAKDDSSKIKWAWGIITAARQITEIKAAQKGKSFPCPKCKSYLEPRRRLAELVIQGCRCY